METVTTYRCIKKMTNEVAMPDGNVFCAWQIVLLPLVAGPGGAISEQALLTYDEKEANSYEVGLCYEITTRSREIPAPEATS